MIKQEDKRDMQDFRLMLKAKGFDAADIKVLLRDMAVLEARRAHINQIKEGSGKHDGRYA